MRLYIQEISAFSTAYLKKVQACVKKSVKILLHIQVLVYGSLFVLNLIFSQQYNVTDSWRGLLDKVIPCVPKGAATRLR